MYKKVLFTAVVLTATLPAIAQDLSNSIELTQLYLVGGATPASWDIGSEKAEMKRVASGVFEWTGHLNQGDFKFMNSRDGWHKHIVAPEDGINIAKGSDYVLDFYADWSLDGSKDLKFNVTAEGEYTLTVDLNSMRMNVSGAHTAGGWADSFCLYGSATGYQPVPLHEINGVEHKGTVTLTPGYVRLVDTANSEDFSESASCFGPRFPGVDLTFGKGFDNPLFPAATEEDGWSVTVEGDYTFYLDNGSHTCFCTKATPYRELFIVGGCCERQWNYWDESNCVFLPDSEDPFLMVWEGELRYGWDSTVNADGSVRLPDEPDKFKILTARDWMRDTFHPYIADTPAEGASDARISGGDDLKWTISRNGRYRLVLDTRTEILTGTFLDSAEAERGAAEAAIDEIHPDSLTSAPLRYINLQGLPEEESGKGICIRIGSEGDSRLIIRR